MSPQPISRHETVHTPRAAWMRGRLGPLRRELATPSEIYTSQPSSKGPDAIYRWLQIDWKRGNNQNLWGLLVTGFELIILSVDLKCRCCPPVREALFRSSDHGVPVYLLVFPNSPRVIVISPFGECIIGTHLSSNWKSPQRAVSIYIYTFLSTYLSINPLIDLSYYYCFYYCN